MTQVAEHLHTMSPIEAWSRMRSQSVGRLALDDGGRPDIFPVNFLADDRRILIRTAAGRKLALLEGNRHVAFEVDQVVLDLAWSVVVRGTAEEITEPGELEAARNAALWTWPARETDRFIRIHPESVVGKSFSRGR